MSKDDLTGLGGWGIRLESIGKRLQDLGGRIQKTSIDPFRKKTLIESADKFLSEVGFENLRPGADIYTSIEGACRVESAEFWSRFSEAASLEGWSIHGTTARRLLARAIFVTMKSDEVFVEGIAQGLSPHVPALISVLKPLVAKTVSSQQELMKFLGLVERAWEIFGAKGEVPLETIYKQVFLLYQGNLFWDSIEPQKFQHISRPLFRNRLSTILERNICSRKGRSIRFGTTLNPKEAWEIFSQAEGRVVQVGRITFEEGTTDAD